MKSELLKKIIKLAKNGTGGEKDNAISILKKICKKHEFNFEDVMRENDLLEFEFEYKGKIALDLVAQIFFSVVGGNSIKHSRYSIFYETTEEKNIEFKNAVSEYKRIYRKERKALNDRHKDEKKIFLNAFINKHNLFSKDAKERSYKDLTDKDIEEMRMSNKLAGEMKEEAKLYKRLN